MSRLRSKVDRGFETEMIRTIRGSGLCRLCGLDFSRPKVSGLPPIYAGLFFGSMAILIVLIYFIVAARVRSRPAARFGGRSCRDPQGICGRTREKAGQGDPRSQGDDRRPPARGGHERTLPLQKGAHTRIAGNLPVMTPRLGVMRFPDPLPTTEGRRDEHDDSGPRRISHAGALRLRRARSHDAKMAECGGACAPSAGYCWRAFSRHRLRLVLSQSFLRRIDAITDTCRRIMAGRLGDRIPVHGAPQRTRSARARPSTICSTASAR